jgi:hypothetical protein
MKLDFGLSWARVFWVRDPRITLEQPKSLYLTLGTALLLEQVKMAIIGVKATCFSGTIRIGMRLHRRLVNALKTSWVRLPLYQGIAHGMLSVHPVVSVDMSRLTGWDELIVSGI